jgi:hypothetical protein
MQLVRMKQRSAGLESDIQRNAIVPVDDFKTCLRALKIRIS